MSGEDLRSKLNAKVEAERQKRADEAEATRKYGEVLRREYPRLAKELLARVTALVDGVTDLRIETRTVTKNLGRTHGSTSSGFETTNLGSVQVPEFIVLIAGQARIKFEPTADHIVGVHGAIVVTSLRSIDLPNGYIYMMPGKDDSEHWELAISTRTPGFRSWTTELSDEKLSDLLEQALS